MIAPDIVVVDSGGANLSSVLHALRRAGVDAALSAAPDRIAAADALVLPGVGAAAPAMARLDAARLSPLLRAWDRPLLGICLGMQLLFEHSEEGDTTLLGLLPGTVRRLRAAPGVQVPHMGWNQLEGVADTPLLSGIAAGDHAYFVHSYAVGPGPDTLATSEHGEVFTAVCGRGRILGSQFHPERSAAVGARIIENFVRIAAQDSAPEEGLRSWN